MPIDSAATRAWAEEHKAAWDLTPLVEMNHGERVQVGFELELYARIPVAITPGDERQNAVLGIWDRLREIAESLGPDGAAPDRLEVDPFDAAGRLRPETGFAPEVQLKARIFHASDYFAPAGADERRLLRPLEERLRELGLRQKSW
jgi:hypothetical protein